MVNDSKLPRMKIILTGATGFIGRKVMESLASSGHTVVVLTRNPAAINTAAWRTVRPVKWDAVRVDDWISELDGADAVVNLAGEPIAARRWRYWQKYRIMFSRVDATRAIVYAIQHAKKKPSVLVNGSAVGYYGDVPNGDVTESHKKGEGFLPNVCEKWEEAALVAQTYGVRVVLLRTGVVLGEDGGALERLALPFKFFAGGWVGSGRQWFPWIHRDDVVNIILHAITDSHLSGPVNVVAPESATMKQFCAGVGRAMRRPSWAPVPGFVLRVALGDMASMLLTGQRAVPAKLSASGFQFTFPTVDGALADIFS
jgi:hypothetical protein